jgi:hypothetical protein
MGKFCLKRGFSIVKCTHHKNPLSYLIYGDEMRDLNEEWDKKGPRNVGAFLLMCDLSAALGLFGPFCGGGIFGRLIPYDGLWLVYQGLCQDFRHMVDGDDF